MLVLLTDTTKSSRLFHIFATNSETT